MTYADIDRALACLGMNCRGGFRLAQTDIPGHRGWLVLVGNAGPAMWQAFRASPEADSRSAGADPLDRWTRRSLDAVAGQFGASALYPFDGPPYHPFQQWAMRAEPVVPSPIGPLLHPRYGLWHAYRGALVIDHAIDFPRPERLASPCQSCIDKPCLSACPVGAFQPGGYDVPACVSHVASDPAPRCRSHGCLARHACPVGQDFAYGPDQAGFHMEKFIDSQSGSGK
ncbi:MAG: hypothetical protein HQ483_11925 [Rhodospirillales bacterium]|nr:hypothetical protein [Rhodospirillales bacterium]